MRRTLKKEIWHEIIYVITIWIIISWGIMFIDIVNKHAKWIDTYQNWEYNLEPKIPTKGLINS